MHALIVILWAELGLGVMYATNEQGAAIHDQGGTLGEKTMHSVKQQHCLVMVTHLHNSAGALTNLAACPGHQGYRGWRRADTQWISQSRPVWREHMPGSGA